MFQTNRHIDAKTEELKQAPKGPLADVKVELAQMKPRLQKDSQDHGKLKRKFGEAHKAHSTQMEAERRRRKEAVEKKAADVVLAKAEKLVKEAEEVVEKVAPAAAAMTSSKAADAKDP